MGKYYCVGVHQAKITGKILVVSKVDYYLLQQGKLYIPGTPEVSPQRGVRKEVLSTVLGAQVSHRMGLGGINEKVAGTIHTLVHGTHISVQGHCKISVSVVWSWNPWVWRDWCYKSWSLVACDEHHGFDLVHLSVLPNQNAVRFDKSWLLFQFLVPSLHSLAARGELFSLSVVMIHSTSEDTKQRGSPKLHHQKSLQRPSQTQLFWLSLGHTDAFGPSNLFSCFLFAWLSLLSVLLYEWQPDLHIA